MGRWRWSNRDTVEECLIIDIAWLNQNGYFCGFKCGRLEWKNAYEEVVSSIGIEVSVLAEDSFQNYIRLNYTSTNNYTGEKSHKDYKIFLDKTFCNYGGFRYWFLCPLSVDNRHCGKRVGKLYLPPGGAYFGCRHCYDLTYQCQKEHDSQLDRLLKYPQMLLAKLKSGNSRDNLLALKASLKLWV